MNATCPAHESSVCCVAEKSESLAVRAARLSDSLVKVVWEFIVTNDQNLGDIEVENERQSRELQRQATEKAAQKKAEGTPPLCPVCKQKLSRVSGGHGRSFESRFGTIRVERERG